MNKYILLIALAFAFASFSCKDDNEPLPLTQRVTLEEMEKLPGYVWVGESFLKYVPDSAMTVYLKALPKNDYKIYAFVPADCDCPSNKKYFSSLAKTLSVINFPDSSMEFYTMQDRRSSHPYMSKISIDFLPAFYVFKDGKPVYSIVDTINANLDRKIDYPNSVEECLYEAMK